MLQYATLADTVYFHFGANDTAGSGADGATPLAYVRLAGAAANAAPVYPTSPATLVPTLLTHANYPPGAHEIAIAATTVNGFAAGNTYAVFCTLLVDSQNPTGFVGSFKLGPVPADAVKIGGTAQSAGRDLGTVLPAVSPTVAGGLAISQEVNGGVWIQVSLLGINGTEIDTDAAGLMAAAFSKLFNVAAPVLTAASVNQSGDAYAVVNHATYGNSALHTDVADVHTDVGTALTNIADLHTDVGTAIANIADLHTDVADVHTDVADVHTDVGTALTNVADLHTDVGTAITQTVAATIGASVMDLANGVETGVTLRQAMRLIGAAVAGKLSGAGTTAETMKGLGGTTTRIVATVDSSGNRTVVTETP